MYHKPLAYGIRAPDIKRIADRNDALTVKMAKEIITKILEDTTRLVMKDMKRWINSKVPKMTGRLRRDILRHLRDSYVSSNVLRIFIQTSIDYAKRVNDFETHNVRHRGKRVKYRGKTYVLHDYKAIGHFFDAMVKFAIHSVKVNLIKVKRKYAARTKMKYIEMKIIKLW